MERAAFSAGLMHEFGHTLSLGHRFGGFNSSMNYSPSDGPHPYDVEAVEQIYEDEHFN